MLLINCLIIPHVIGLIVWARLVYAFSEWKRTAILEGMVTFVILMEALLLIYRSRFRHPDLKARIEVIRYAIATAVLMWSIGIWEVTAAYWNPGPGGPKSGWFLILYWSVYLGVSLLHHGRLCRIRDRPRGSLLP